MKKYNWNYYTIVDRIQLLERMLKKETDPEVIKSIKYDIDNLKDYLVDFYQDPEINDINLLKKYNLFKKRLEKIPYIWPEIKIFNDDTKESLYGLYPVKQNFLSKKDILDITYDFYKSLDSTFFTNF